MKTKKHVFEKEFAGQTLRYEIGELAEQANAAVFAHYGETSVLVTVVMSKNVRESIDYMPLTVDYEERFYAAGKILGSRFLRREGRASTEAMLNGRLIDRALRPLFNPWMRNDVQIIATVLSFDGKNDPAVLGLNAASLALLISDIPWSGPIGALRVGQANNEFVVGMAFSENSSLDAVLAGSQEKIIMIEAGADQISESDFLDSIQFSQKYLGELVDFQNEIAQKIGQTKKAIVIEEPDKELMDLIEKIVGQKLDEALYRPGKIERMEELGILKEEWRNAVKEKWPDDFLKLKLGENAFEEKINAIVHRNIIEKNKRPDGRQLDEVRPLSVSVPFLKRAHGSALFVRGQTQSLSILTLGAPGDELLIEGMEIREKKRFIHHYNFPPFSSGEIKPLRGPGRREIGHGALAEKALLPIIPNQEKFPYTIRIVSEILSSNGSTSMASATSSTLALMDAGVPIKEMVTGIAMGLMSDEKGNFKILTDIQGPEDHHGDMDLKVAGTKNGITAIQMDVKVHGVSEKILAAGIKQAKEAREHILKTVREAISEPRPELSPYAPRVLTIQINPEKIGEVIGPGGKMINKIIAETGAEIDIEDSGVVFITAENPEAANKALAWVKNIVREAKPGEIFEGKVVRIMDFGAFVEILPGQDGLVHISEISPKRIEKVTDVLKIGDIVTVKVKNIDELGRINLTIKGAK
ncbi:MAG: polyribonucleotide nucleotidyltransferase [Parcubacteria group bacterium]|nr:polyribonucleotide nucleotidyltransferase [Parcubacteria group bacterium]